jgi:exodeoxyribonuclease VII large subunit
MATMHLWKMAELAAGKKTYTLLDLAESIQRMFSSHYTQKYWVKAELNKLNHYSHSGHCYPELLQKENGKTVVEFKSILWKNDYERINRLFLDQIKEPLTDGIKVLCEVTVTYAPQYGLSLRIHDIDISYTIGDIEAEKKAAIERLQREGIFNLNKTCQHAILPKRIAVISVESSKGFADFQEILDAEQGRFSIFRMLFPALLQGDKAVESLLLALKRVRQVAHHFDAVAIIRGGGGDVGLSCFNHIELARTIATFPIPVYTGIGHSTNETVCEMVSHYNGITPTKVAQQLLDQFVEFAHIVQEAKQTIAARAREMLTVQSRELHMHIRIIQQSATSLVIFERERLNRLSDGLTASNRRIQEKEIHSLQTLTNRISTGSNHQLLTSRERIKQMVGKLSMLSAHQFSRNLHTLENLERIVSISDPKNMFKRGYSLTSVNGIPLRDTSTLKAGDRVVTTLMSGSFESEVIQIKS